jgi:predicted DNA-binding protein with PD1-like motif
MNQKKKLEVKVKPLHQKEHKNVTYKTMRIMKTNNKSFKEEDIKQYINDKVAKNYDIRDIAVSGMGITNTFTMKYYDNDEFYNTNDYYEDKVEDVEKFDDYEFFDVTVRIWKN